MAPLSVPVMDALSLSLNVSTSVLIVFVNKVLMDPKHGYGFVFATSLCSLHFFVSGFAVRASEWLGYGTRTPIPIREILWFSFIAGTSVATLNLSLLVNSVGFYQISKLLIIPFVCIVEAAWYKKRYTFPVLLCVLTVIVGVGIVTVTDMNMNLVGFVIAMISVVTSGLQQILCGVVQRKHGLTSTQLLSNTAPVQGLLLLGVGPLVDQAVTQKWIGDYHFSTPGLECLIASCTIAIVVNISQFLCLGRFSALTFQVLGHAKTVLVLLAGWMYLHDQMNLRKLAGMVLAVLGMVGYGYFNSRPALQPQQLFKDKLSQPLLNGKHSQSDSQTTILVTDLVDPDSPQSPMSNQKQS